MRGHKILAMMIFAAACVSCGDDGESDNSVDKRSCTFIKSTPTAITASSDRASAPAITPGETAYDVTLSASSKTYVRFDAQAAGTWVLFLDAANVASGKYFDGATEKSLPASAANENCAADIPDHYHVNVSAAGAVAIELDPSATKVVIAIAPDEDEEE
jgi:hypothetical protein